MLLLLLLFFLIYSLMVVFANHLTLNYAMANHLNCVFSTWSNTLWPNFKYFQVQAHNFLSSDKNKSFTFSGSSEEKLDSIFYGSPTVEFIPVSIFSEYSNINVILIYVSNIPITKKDCSYPNSK
jgi:hypothetical protein